MLESSLPKNMVNPHYPLQFITVLTELNVQCNAHHHFILPPHCSSVACCLLSQHYVIIRPFHYNWQYSSFVSGSASVKCLFWLLLIKRLQIQNAPWIPQIWYLIGKTITVCTFVLYYLYYISYWVTVDIVSTLPDTRNNILSGASGEKKQTFISVLLTRPTVLCVVCLTHRA